MMVLAAAALVGKTQHSTVNGPAGNTTRGSVNGTARKEPLVLVEALAKLTAGSPSPEGMPVTPFTTLVLE